jgi:hypothetical protein
MDLSDLMFHVYFWVAWIWQFGVEPVEGVNVGQLLCRSTVDVSALENVVDNTEHY